MVNGEVFKPGGAQLTGGSLSCNYQFLNGGYYFRLSGVKGSGNNQTAVGLFTDSLKIRENLILSLDSASKGSVYGSYFGLGSSQQDWSYRTGKPIYTGELLIKKLDSINQIVSGTFWFDGVNGGGQKVEIREGRFDVRYTK